MAKRVDSFERFPKARGPGRPPKYPWETWLDGEPWELEQGSDFDGTVKGFRENLIRVGKRRGLEVEVSVSVPLGRVRLRAIREGENK